MSSDPFWFDDINIIWRSDRLNEFFPSEDQVLEERMNAIVRLSLYISLILCAYHKRYNYVSFFIGGCIFTYFIYMNRKVENMVENLGEINTTEKRCTKPTKENPFMNFTMADRMNIDEKIGKTVDKLPACDPSEPGVKREIEESFNNNLYRDVNDVFGKMNSQRQFYTMPWTSNIPDENGEFRDWLYKTDSTCKENSQCLRYEDVRANAPIFPNPNVNPHRF